MRINLIKDKPHYTYANPMFAAGSGVILFYKPRNTPHTLKVGIGLRKKSVGEGAGVSGGGFVEAETLLNYPKNHALSGPEEAFRELCEENKGIENTINFYRFMEDVQPLPTLYVRVEDDNVLHAATSHALRVTRAEAGQIEKLKGSEEAHGIKFCTMVWTPDINYIDPHMVTEIHLPKDFPTLYHPHERRAFGFLARLAHTNRLW